MRRFSTFLIALLLAGVALVRWSPLAGRTPVHQAWSRASDAASYRYTSTIVQTVNPLPSLANVGLSAKDEHLYIEGNVDRAQGAMHMRLWAQSGSPVLGTGALEIEAVEGRVRGRAEGQPWQPLDGSPDLAAPGDDPLGFLQSAINVVDQGPRALPLPGGTATLARYTFDIDSASMAASMRDYTERQLRSQGKLAPAMGLDLAPLYRDMAGSGELLVDQRGLPVRLQLRLRFPPADDQQIDAVITSDFQGWVATPSLLGLILPTPPQARQLGLTLLVLALFAGLGALLLYLRRSRKAYALLVALMILSMLGNPLLAGQQQAAFAAEQRAQDGQRKAEQGLDSDLAGAQAQPEWDPHQPLRSLTGAAPAQPTAPLTGTDPPVIYDDGTDTDGDGLTDVDEGTIGTDPLLIDTDGDGLDDHVEVVELGTLPSDPQAVDSNGDGALEAIDAGWDSDSDGITDTLEVRGFAYASQQWYLNPLGLDTNQDSLFDGAECSADTGALICPDTDGDGTPDVFDDDNDNDGVLDRDDLDPTVAIGSLASGLADDQLQYSLSNLQPGQPTFVDFQLRTVNPEHLWYTLNVLDWPSGDRAGQIQRVLTNTLGTGGALANGDMRLVPMLELELPGSALQLDTLNPQQQVDLLGDGGTAELTQQGASFKIVVSFSAASAYALQVVAGSCDQYTVATDWGMVQDGQTLLYSNQYLTGLADGEHAIVLRAAGAVIGCTLLPNLINGPYQDRIIDQHELAELGISLREKDSAGTLAAYVPLRLERDREHNAPYAFSARMLYQPWAGWGAAHTARLVWLVSMLTDACAPIPADFLPGLSASERSSTWCSNDANWSTQGTTVVHSYADDWYLTGMRVREDHGVKLAAVIQNPAYTQSSAPNEDALWLLAQGLDQSFMAGRGNSSSQRTFTIDTIKQRWDSRSNPTSTAEERWNIDRQALIVERFDAGHQLAVLPAANASVPQLLDTYLGPQITTGVTNPLVLFASEERYRARSLGSPAQITAPGGGWQAGVLQGNAFALSVSTGAAPLVTSAGLKWSPFEQQDGQWVNTPIADYWSRKEPGWRADLSARWSDSDEIQGALTLTGFNYLSLAHGVELLIDLNGFASGSRFGLSDAMLAEALNLPGYSPLQLTVKRQLGAFAGYEFVYERRNTIRQFLMKKFPQRIEFIDFSQPIFDLDSISEVFKHDYEVFRGNPSANWLDDLRKTDPDNYWAQVAPDATVKASTSGALRKMEQFARGATYLGYGTTVVSLGSSLASAIYSYGVGSQGWAKSKVAEITFQGITAANSTMQIIAGVAKLSLAVGVESVRAGTSTGTAFVNVLKAAGREGLQKVASTASIVGVILTSAVSLLFFAIDIISSGTLFLSLAFDQALAEVIASIIVAIILIAIEAIPLIGPIITALIALIDAVIMIICLATNTSAANVFICNGLTGLATHAVAWYIYDQEPLVDLQRGDRLNFSNLRMSLRDPSRGFVGTNYVTVSTTIDTALYYEPLMRDGELPPPPQMLAWRWMFNDDNLRRTTMDYALSTETTMLHEPLALDQMTGAWQPPDPQGWAADSVFVAHLPITGSFMLNTGINSPAQFFALHEGYAIPTQECVNVGLAACWLRTDKNTLHVPLSEMFTFDVFPPSLDEFVALAPRDGGSALAWDPTFPLQADPDGDGLRSVALGGNDPDDATGDADSDGLSDYLELALGTDPADADSDSDTVSDGAELRYQTNPYLADTDYDGISDGAELAGWLINYDLSAGGTPLTTRIWSDPLDPNADHDELLDGQEQAYGTHPQVYNDSAIFTLSSQVALADSVVRPGETIPYQLQITNQLRDRSAEGLLGIDFPAAAQSSDLRPTNFVALPSQTISMTGQVQVSASLNQSQAISLTNIAGAVPSTLHEQIDGRTLWLHLNEPSGSTLLRDASLHEHNLDCSGLACPALNQPGRKSGAASFASVIPQLPLIRPSGAKVTFGDLGLKPAASLGRGFTVLAWIKDSQLSGYQPLLHTTFANNGVSALRLGLVDNKPSLQANGTTISGSALLTPDRWHHVAWRYTMSGTIDMYVDGQLALSAPLPSTFLDTLAGQAAWLAGQNFPPTTIDQIDELEVYPRPLSVAEILAARNNSLVFYSNFDTAPTGAVPWLDNSAYANTMRCADITGDPNTYRYCPYRNPATGVIGASYNFHIDENDPSLLDVLPNEALDLSKGAGAFTISVWAWPTLGSGHIGPIIGNRPGTPTQFYPQLHVLEDTIRLKFGPSSGPCALQVSNLVMHDRWHHVVATFDGSTARIYADTALIGEQACAGIRPPALDTFAIGGDSLGSYYGGPADELRIYDYALAADAISDLFRQTQATVELRFDEAPGRTEIRDHSLSGINATCGGTACPVTGVPGRINRAADFDGADDVLDIGASSQLGLTDHSFTLAAWVKFASLPSGRMTVLGNTSAGSNALQLGLVGGKPFFRAATVAVTGTTALVPDRWYHLAARYAYDPVNYPRGVRTLFVDGAQAAQDIRNTSDTPVTSSTPIRVGGIGAIRFAGQIDDIQIFRQPLENSAIVDLVKRAPAVHLHLDEAAGSAAFASSGNPILDAACAASCPAAGVKGRIYQGVRFAGSAGLRITSPTPVPIAADTSQFSMGLWVRPRFQRPTAQELLRVDLAGSAINNRLWIKANSNIISYSLAVCSPGSTAITRESQPLVQNIWNHVMLTFNGESAALYINGALVDTSPLRGKACQMTMPVDIGAANTSNFFSGDLDEVVVYPSALSAAEVRELATFQALWFDTSYSHPITVDADNPAVAWPYASILGHRAHILQIPVSDATSGIAELRYRVNGGAWNFAVNNGDAWALTLTPRNAPGTEMVHDLTFKAFDQAGNSTTIQPQLLIDGSPPVIGDVVLPTAPLPVTREGSHSLLHLSGSVTATGSPLAELTVQIFNSSGTPVSLRQPASVSGTAWSIDASLELRPKGSYTARISATDGVGNQATRTEQLSIDGAAPVATIASIGAARLLVERTATLTGTLREEGAAGVAAAEIAFVPQGRDDLSSAHWMQAGLVAHLPLDENQTNSSGAPTRSFVSTTGAAKATCEAASCPTPAAPGYKASALAFASGQRLSISGLTLNAANSVSLGVWVRPQNTSASAPIWRMADADTSVALLYDADQQRFSISSASQTLPSATVAAPDQWHHVMLTLDPVGGAVLYVDGSAALSLTTALRPANLRSLGVGAEGAQSLLGLIDDIVIYDRALAAAEARQFWRGYQAVLNLALDADSVADGQTLADTSIYAHQPLLTLGAGQSVESGPGRVGGAALSFDGQNDSISVPPSPALSFEDGQYTQMLWVRPTNPTGITPIALLTSKAAPSPAFSPLDGPALYLTAAGKLSAGFGDGSQYHTYTTNAMLPFGAWSFVAVTFDGTVCSFYIDGALVEQTNALAGYRPLSTAGRPLLIGRSLSNAVRRLRGQLDEVALYRQALSAADITMRYHQGWQPTSLAAAGAQISATTWQAQVPAELGDGMYQLELRTSDTNANQSYGSQASAQRLIVVAEHYGVYLPLMMRP